MLGHEFYFQTTRKMVVMFGTLFNDITITRTDATGAVIQILKVPLSYAPKDKILARIDADPDMTGKQASVTLPRMSFEMGSPSFDSNRNLQTRKFIVRKVDDDGNVLKSQYFAKPYDFPFTLYVFAKNAEDATKIVEQIYPFFCPSFVPTVHLVPEHDITLDIPVIIGPTTVEDTYADNYKGPRRAIVWAIPFTVKGWYFGPVETKKIIKFAKMSFYVGNQSENTANTYVARVTTQPGLTADREPTTDINESIDPNLIYIDDDFGFVDTFEGPAFGE